MGKTAFFTVFYPTELSYHQECINSLRNQTIHEFDLFIVNDGVDDLDSFILKNYPYSYEILSFTGDMFQIREQGIKYLLNIGYENIIFGDSDDYFSSNRVEVTKSLLEKNDLVINEVSLVTKDSKSIKENYFGKRLPDNFLFERNFIDDKNIIGFSNTAIKSFLLKDVSFACSSLALDWFVFTQAMRTLSGSALFTHECQTYYRQYDGSIADTDLFTLEKFQKGLNVKRGHYKSLAACGIGYYENFYRQTEDLWLNCQDEQFCQKYFSELSHENITNPFWWERIKLGRGKNANSIN